MKSVHKSSQLHFFLLDAQFEIEKGGKSGFLKFSDAGKWLNSSNYTSHLNDIRVFPPVGKDAFRSEYVQHIILIYEI